MMQGRTASIICIPEYAPDKAAMLAALKIVLRQPLDPEIALRQSEAHARDCVTCSVGGPDGLCPDGVWYRDRAERAAQDAVR